MDVAVVVSRQVLQVLGGRQATQAILTDAGPFQCPVCAQPGRLGPDTPASVVVVLHDGGAGRRVVCLAHPDCCPPAVVVADDPGTTTTSAPQLAAQVWVRRPDDEPPVVVACRPPHPATAAEVGPSSLTRTLLAHGFGTPTCPASALPHAPQLSARQRGPVLGVHAPDGRPLFRVMIDFGLPWWRTAVACGRLGVVVATGHPGGGPGDCRVDVISAVAAGQAIGATLPLAS